MYHRLDRVPPRDSICSQLVHSVRRFPLDQRYILSFLIFFAGEQPRPRKYEVERCTHERGSETTTRPAFLYLH